LFPVLKIFYVSLKTARNKLSGLEMMLGGGGLVQHALAQDPGFDPLTAK
jgi:hypothetical protein